MSTPPKRFPTYLSDIWAKSAKSNQAQGESLEEHSWHTVARMAELARLRTLLPEECGEPRLWHRLFWACLMHDFGKSASGFQKMLRTGEPWKRRHEVLSLAFVDWMFPPGSPDRLWVVAAVASHHRDVDEIKDYIHDDLTLEQMVSEVDRTSVEGVWRWLSEGVPGWIAALGLAEFGVVMLSLPGPTAVATFHADSAARIKAALKDYWNWAVPPIGKPRPGVGQIIPSTLMRGYIMQSDHTASAHAGELPHADFDAVRLRRAWGWGEFSSRAHQDACAEQTGSALLIAPTGSGKTEAALLWACRQAQERGGLPRLFYTLPYQASMNAMLDRLRNSFPDEKRAGGQSSSLVGIQHGRSLLALYRRLMDKYGSADDSGYNLKRAEREARWLKNLATLNHPPLRVFSPYQMLKGFYRLKGYEALLADYYDAAFIFDEIHAYEVKRLALILKSVEYLAQHYRARFLFMSATFPKLIRQQLETALGGQLPRIEATPELYQQFRRHRLKLRDGELTNPAVLAEIVGQVGQGKAVLVCVNTVKRAQALYKDLGPQVQLVGGEIVLLHGRFNGEDRLDKEKRINDAVGPKSETRHPLLVVATQAIEVSLDIDLDMLYTDPAPLEALIQRFGRINRHQPITALAEVFVFREPADGQRIYDEALVTATLKILEREKDEPIDEAAVGKWLDEIYSGEIATKWQQEYDKAASDFQRAIVDTLRPFQSEENIEEQFDDLFEGTELLPAQLETEYNEREAADRLDASALLVPVGIPQLMALRRKEMVRERQGGKKKWPRVTEAIYSSEYGLDLESGGA